MAGTSIGTATVNIVPSMKGFTSAINGAVSKVNAKSSGKKLGSSLSDGIGGALSSGGAALAGIMFFYVMKKKTALDAVNLGAKKPVGRWFLPFGRFVYVPLCIVALVAGAILGGIG